MKNDVTVHLAETKTMLPGEVTFLAADEVRIVEDGSLVVLVENVRRATFAPGAWTWVDARISEQQ